MPEQLIPSKYLLTDALRVLGSEDVIEKARDLRVIFSKFPLTPQIERGTNRQWTSFDKEQVTGLRGWSTVEAQGVVAIPDRNKSKQIFVKIKPGDYWEVRCDYDPEKHSHVNVRVGDEKFAFLYPEGNIMRDPATAPNPYFDYITEQTRTVRYQKGMSEVELAACAKELAEYYCSILRNRS